MLKDKMEENYSKMTHTAEGKNKEEMNGISALVLRSFPVPFHRSLGLLRSYHIPKKWTAFRNGNYFFRSLTCMHLTLRRLYGWFPFSLL